MILCHMQGNPRQDSGLHAVDSGFQVLDSGFWIICQWNLDPRFRLLVGFWIPFVGFRIREPRIPDFTSKSPRIPDSSSKKVPDSLRTRCKMLVRMIVKQIKPARPGPGYLLVKCVNIWNFFLNSHFTRHGCD